jgi:hypothetical protein
VAWGTAAPGPRGEMRILRIARRLAAVAPIATAFALVGCGGDDADYANNPRPPAPINVTVAISDDKVSVSPRRFGAGPIVLLISNQSSDAQQVTLETDELGGDKPGIRPRTSPINPRGTTQLKVSVREGSYKLSVADDAIRPANLRVGAPRPSAQNELLQP